VVFVIIQPTMKASKTILYTINSTLLQFFFSKSQYFYSPVKVFALKVAVYGMKLTVIEQCRCSS